MAWFSIEINYSNSNVEEGEIQGLQYRRPFEGFCIIILNWATSLNMEQEVDFLRFSWLATGAGCWQNGLIVIVYGGAGIN